MSLLEQYAQLKKQSKQITKQLKELEPQVLDQIMALDGEKLEAEYGTYSVISKKVWKYSDELVQKEADVKEMLKLKKREEELKGTATLEAIRSSLRFQASK